uniref:Uncharacterized protein n=1 Tax=Solanum lycopersicum TaxID=4081 RepID=A0A3Q7FST9_SOLLC
MKLEVRIEPTSVLEAFHSKAQTLLSLYFLMDHDILVHDIPGDGSCITFKLLSAGINYLPISVEICLRGKGRVSLYNCNSAVRRSSPYDEVTAH